MPDLIELPGHMIRRLQQIAVAVFQSELGAVGSDLTPVQYAALRTINERPGLDQATLAGLIAYDRATIGGVVERLLSKGLIVRDVNAIDRRARVLTIAPKGREMLDLVEPSVQRAQTVMLGGLDESEAAQFMRLLRKTITTGNES
ncbi:putative transcriptional regulatory protein, MarR family [Pseudorhizobium banfieldiae]|uniref:Putative transcriptional regulatory protein, MarR family n=1 Tax=Pseudorhizobium banfieldiae TaxID=1125847 RepID=L0NB68_9HYPH|nr:MarR family winged helix-turn-helix transcriptional regulator [Pseudorhizobium banfieldiae]CAD6601996.1 MarR family transcriptional regulator [arsenite-oxidising bacterium NT-25]CAD6606411.1 MarR family transcriptional regulator [Rhizobium sp. TCK]CCF18338.1 putative transcriptional regulatory protein, MarR family [Pseudorhizobium banfieldiae]